MLIKQTLQEFISQLGSEAATPGGGGAAALCGANAAALITMVARLTTGRPAFAGFENRLQQIILEGDQLQTQLLNSIEADAQAFEKVMAAYALPKTPKEARQVELQIALVGATDSPIQIAHACHQVCQLAAELADKGNPQTITDAGTAALLSQAALQSAILQARINLKAIKDTDYKTKTQTTIDDLTAQTALACQQALAAVNQKLN